MNDEDKRYLCTVFDLLERSMGNTLAHGGDRVDMHKFMAWHGLGVLDATAIKFPEFYEWRKRYMDGADNDVKAFLTASRAFYDWLESLDIVEHIEGAQEHELGAV